MAFSEKSFGATVDDDESVVYDTLKEACRRRILDDIVRRCVYNFYATSVLYHYHGS
jgi:hypothetical protein